MRMAAPMPVMVEMRNGMEEDEIVVTASRKAEQEDFGDYKLYRIPAKVTVAPYQTKQLAFLNEPEVGVEQVYALDLDDVNEDVSSVAIRYDIDNDKDGTLAKALPKGTVRVFAPSVTVGRAFVGEDDIDDIPVGLPAKIMAGKSVTVFGVGEEVSENVGKLTLTNAGKDTAIVVIRDVNYTKTRVDGYTREADEDIPTWRVTVDPESQTELTIRRKN